MLKVNPSEIVSVTLKQVASSDIQLDMLRDDLIHPIISGNKWRKLKYLIQDAKVRGASRLISMGGNYSNHLHALAYAGKELGFSTVGYVRAHQEQELTPTLKDCQRWGMQLVFVDRNEYKTLRLKRKWDSFSSQYPNSYWMPEGGYSELAIKGVQAIGNESTQQYDYVFCGVGTGATLAGLVKAFPESRVIGVAAFKGADYLQLELAKYLSGYTNWRLDSEHHCGGFAKSNQQLKAIKSVFEQENGFIIDNIYNAKVLYALQDYIADGKIPSGSKVLWINTGGLQGERT